MVCVAMIGPTTEAAAPCSAWNISRIAAPMNEPLATNHRAFRPNRSDPRTEGIAPAATAQMMRAAPMPIAAPMVGDGNRPSATFTMTSDAA